MHTVRRNPLSVSALRDALFAAITLACASRVTPCHAGPNAYGTLILHQNPALQGSCGGSLNGRSGIERCEDAVTRVDDPRRCAVVFVLASFPSWQTPSLRSVSFGFEYDETELSLSNLSSAGDFESSTGGWPASGSGTAIVWNESQTDRLVEVYALAVEAADTSPTKLRLIPHPIQGGLFIDPIGTPDPIYRLGALGWMEDGELPCAPETGACCTGDDRCVVLAPLDCVNQGGVFAGGGIACEPGTCPASSGACCVDQSCLVLTAPQCAEINGRFLGAGESCRPNSCVPDVGACCYADGSCSMVPEEICTSSDGVFGGYDVNCDVFGCAGLFGCGPERARSSASKRGETPAVHLSGGGGSRGEIQELGDPACGTELFNTDGTFEYAYGWQYGGVVPPYYGALAECFEGQFTVCAINLLLTRLPLPFDNTIDLYVWEDEGGCPGAVVCARLHLSVGWVANWPDVTQYRFAIPGCCVADRWWVGYWGNWPGGANPYYIAADLDGPNPGCPKTCIAPGIGYPSGWQNVSVVWGPTVAIGIGAEVLPCGPVPVERTSWGKIKALYGPPR